MAKEIPHQLRKRYEVLFKAFGNKEFRFEDAVKVFMEQNKDAWEQVPAFLSELQRSGLLLVESDVHG
ncbi:MAG: hypothetical protein ABC536_06865, partial [Candidatus Methanosuratincola petrocarbonis]